MSVPHLAQLRELQDENVKLQRMYADLALMHQPSPAFAAAVAVGETVVGR